jgi:ornithine carbamoyltransferase|tara:strand:+ start:5280 stop:6185 length:906 start_codon:yes stop_codon:yes gene_type:complete
MAIRHFLTLKDCSSSELKNIIARAHELKSMQHLHQPHLTAQGRVMAMIFEKSSTRTRVSFETGMAQLGGHALFLSPTDTQMGRGEPIEDTAKVISSIVDIVMIRTFAHSSIETFAKASSVPVINALTDSYHPCQLLADMQAFEEARGSIQGESVAWIGDGNNMCNSYINAAAQWDFELRIACPEGFDPDAGLLEKHSDRIVLTRSADEAASGANIVVTDTWASMGQEKEKDGRSQLFAPYQVNTELMSKAASDAVFMHCLPAYRGSEVTAEVIDHPETSIVWQEAENRLHTQKALIEFLLN